MSIGALIVFPILAVAIIIGVSLLMKKYFDFLNRLGEKLSTEGSADQAHFGKTTTFYVMAVCLFLTFLFSRVSTTKIVPVDDWALIEVFYITALGVTSQFKMKNMVSLLLMLYVVSRLYLHSQGVGWPNLFFLFATMLATVLAFAKPREAVNGAGM